MERFGNSTVGRKLRFCLRLRKRSWRSISKLTPLMRAVGRESLYVAPLGIYQFPKGGILHKYVRNILKTYSEASNIELQAGREWYDRAELLARTLCPNNVCRGAGVIATLSPRQTWDMNKKGAEKIIRAVDNHSSIIPTVAGTYSNIQKAWDIAQGADPVKVLSSGTRPDPGRRRRA